MLVEDAVVYHGLGIEEDPPGGEPVGLNGSDNLLRDCLGGGCSVDTDTLHDGPGGSCISAQTQVAVCMSGPPASWERKRSKPEAAWLTVQVVEEQSSAGEEVRAGGVRQSQAARG